MKAEMSRKIVGVVIRIFRPCARCGHEEEAEEITRMFVESVTVQETDRVTVEHLFDNKGES